MLLARRQFLTGLASVLAAPAIVRIDSIMPVRLMLPSYDFDSFDGGDPVRDFVYQWNVLVSHFDSAARTVPFGWTPVPASRYNDRFDIKGDYIVHGNCLLVEKPRIAFEEARGREIAAARALHNNSLVMKAGGLDWSLLWSPNKKMTS